MILGLRRLRGRITTRQHARWQFASLFAFCLIAAAILLLLEGYVILGIATLMLGGLASWLTGLWVMPGSVDGYYRKLSRILRDIDVQNKRNKDIDDKDLRSLTLRIAELGRSRKEDKLYKEIIAECEMIDTLIENRIGFDHVREIGEHRRRLLKFGNVCEANTADPTRQELARTIVRRASVIVRDFDAAYELLESQACRVVGIKVPVKLKTQHQRYLEALNAYITAFGDVREVMIVQDKDENIEGDVVAAASARRQELANLTQVLSDEQHLSWRDPRRAAGRTPGAA